MSIGEEQSDSTVLAMAWSSPGMSRHQRPALAVLTTNHLLSLWASASDIEDHSSWKRVLVFNDLEFGVHHISCMAWATHLPPPKNSVGYKKQKFGTQIIAVAVDDGSLQFHSVSSPYTSEVDLWHSTELCSIDLTSKDLRGIHNDGKDRPITMRCNKYSLFGKAMETSSQVYSMAVGPWRSRDGVFETAVSIHTRGSLFQARLLLFDNGTSQARIESTE